MFSSAPSTSSASFSSASSDALGMPLGFNYCTVLSLANALRHSLGCSVFRGLGLSDLFRLLLLPDRPLSFQFSFHHPYSSSMRRLIVSCDGTWQSALYQEDPRKYTNITRLDSSFNRQDTRHSPPIEQIKLYVPGLGTGQELMIGAMSVRSSRVSQRRSGTATD